MKKIAWAKAKAKAHPYGLTIPYILTLDEMFVKIEETQLYRKFPVPWYE